jgi:putative membrane protein insertion efficiency factor
VEVKFRSIALQLVLIALNALSFFSRVLIGIYRTVFTNHLGGNCRFEPSCSHYALECFHKYSFLRACHLTLKRLSKCHPLGSSGFDPVPEPNTWRNHNAK